jgi:penicillin-insensitive murein endopeptidase
MVADEMVGTPIRLLEMPVPGEPRLPTPADALGMSGLPGEAAASSLFSSSLYTASAFVPSGGVILSSVGFYSRGKIWSYEQLQTNDLWTVRNPARAYANYFIVEPMKQGARAYLEAEPDADLLRIWDISKEGGGYGSGHASHQLGLDADIEYPYSIAVKRGAPKSMKTIDYFKTWSLVKSYVATGKVQRMFMANEIKRELCKLAVNDEDKLTAINALKKLRYWPGHENHIHFRFYCPPGDKLCVPQVEVPPGSGCGALGVRGL